MSHGPRSIKTNENRGPDGPGGLPGEPWEPFWSPKLSRAENRRKNECPRLPQTPPKVTLKWQSRDFFAFFFRCFSKLVFWRARDFIFHDFWAQNRRKIGPAWCLFGVLFPCLFLIRFFIVFLVFFYRCQFCEDVVFDAEPLFFLSGFDMAALLKCFKYPRNTHPTHHKNL